MQYLSVPQWLKVTCPDDDCDLPELIKTVPHLAFVVDDIEKELEDNKYIP